MFSIGPHALILTAISVNGQVNPKLCVQRQLGATFWNVGEGYVPEPALQSNRCEMNMGHKYRISEIEHGNDELKFRGHTHTYTMHMHQGAACDKKVVQKP